MKHHDSKKHDDSKGKSEDFLASCHWIICAISVTLVFIVFVMQAYTIPTGSMADTLKGAHFRLCCQSCGYGYDYNYHSEFYRTSKVSVPPQNVGVLPGPIRCPNCGFFYQQEGYRAADGSVHIKSEHARPVTKGDRIFVGKCIYQFTEPKRWDVVVFKNPTNPYENYIKRLIALPGESLEIIDGDIYINGSIARKPADVQCEVWMPVFDNDYQPAKPAIKNYNGHKWKQPFENTADSRWNLKSDDPTVFTLDSTPGAGKTHTISYNTELGNDFKATYAYDRVDYYSSMPICSDLKVRFAVETSQAESGVGAILTKHGVEYNGWVDFKGRMIINETVDGKHSVLKDVTLELPGPTDKPIEFSFANVDHRLVLKFGKNEITHDLGDEVADVGQANGQMPKVNIFGDGKLKLSHVAIFRDMHYLSNNTLRAHQGDPFELDKDEFFVCGDNSPASYDSRLWKDHGKGNGKEYDLGIVPREYMIGKAFVVYWPGPLKPYNDTALGKTLDKHPLGRIAKIFMNVPYIDGIKTIKGGSSKSQEK